MFIVIKLPTTNTWDSFDPVSGCRAAFYLSSIMYLILHYDYFSHNVVRLHYDWADWEKHIHKLIVHATTDYLQFLSGLLIRIQNAYFINFICLLGVCRYNLISFGNHAIKQCYVGYHTSVLVKGGIKHQCSQWVFTTYFWTIIKVYIRKYQNNLFSIEEACYLIFQRKLLKNQSKKAFL